MGTRSYFETRRHLSASLPGTVLREGGLLHATRPGPRYGHASLALAREVHEVIIAWLPEEVRL